MIYSDKVGEWWKGDALAGHRSLILSETLGETADLREPQNVWVRTQIIKQSLDYTMYACLMACGSEQELSILPIV